MRNNKPRLKVSLSLSPYYFVLDTRSLSRYLFFGKLFYACKLLFTRTRILTLYNDKITVLFYRF